MADVNSGLRQDTTTMALADPFSNSAPPASSVAVGYVASIAMTALATVVAVGIDNGMEVPNVSLVFVVPVIIAGLTFGLGPSLCSAVLGALAYNFFLTEPRYTLAVNDPANVWAIGLLFLVGLIVSSIAYTSRRRATDAALLRRQATVLQSYSRDVVAVHDTNGLLSITSQALSALFQVPVVVILVAQGNIVAVNTLGTLKPQETDLAEAQSSLEMGIAARAGVYPALTSRFDFWPVNSVAGPRAVIGLAFDPERRPGSPETVVDVIASLLALALDVGRDTRPGR